MNYPKLKYPRLCRILTYLVVIGIGLLPIVIVFSFSAPDIIKIITILGCLLGLLFYIVRNFMVLMAMDTTLALLSCFRTARTQYTLPKNRTPEKLHRSILNFGISCEPIHYEPQPFALRYQFSSSLTYYARGIERVVAAYEADLLDRDTYCDILRSAKVNSKALEGKRKARLLDSSQKNAPLHRVTVVLIFTYKVDPQLAADMYDVVCKQCGDEEKDCTIPCVVDLAQYTCVFNSLRVPYIGFSYAVKNRGIRLIKKCIFGGNLNLRGNTMHVVSDMTVNLENSLWDLWKDFHHQLIGAERQTKRRFEGMSEKEIFCEKDCLYLKWDQRGICQSIKTDNEKKLVQVELLSDWYYPKIRPIGKKTLREITEHITSYFEKSGYSVRFVSIDEMT